MLKNKNLYGVINETRDKNREKIKLVYKKEWEQNLNRWKATIYDAGN